MALDDYTVYLVTYEGQWDGKHGDSPYTICCYSYGQAIAELEEQQELYPNRKYSICEKDVS